MSKHQQNPMRRSRILLISFVVVDVNLLAASLIWGWSSPQGRVALTIMLVVTLIAYATALASTHRRTY